MIYVVCVAIFERKCVASTLGAIPPLCILELAAGILHTKEFFCGESALSTIYFVLDSLHLLPLGDDGDEGKRAMIAEINNVMLQYPL